MKEGRVRRVCLITSAHVCSHPRVIKEAGALQEAGFQVRVVSMNHEASKDLLDKAMVENRHWQLHTVDAQRRGKGRMTWLLASLRQKLFCSASFLRRVDRGSDLAFSRFLPELTRLAWAEPADLFIAHTPQTLPVCVAAANAFGTIAGVDFEDLFSGMKRFDAESTLEDTL